MQKPSLRFAGTLILLVCSACAKPKIDLGQITRPERSGELDAYQVFVGEWKWEAEMLNAEGADRKWNGTAEWHWGLDRRYLMGSMKSKSERAQFESSGVWSWHPTRKEYRWWMFNDWGYPQEGKAKYDERNRSWQMPYISCGLDGTTSHGEYCVTVVDNNTLQWTAVEWADALHMVKKMEMRGTYKRAR